MLKCFRPRARRSFASLVYLGLLGVLGGYGTSMEAQVTRLAQIGERVELGVTAVADITPSVSGTNYLQTGLTANPSNTVGVVTTLRYTRSALMGAELNFGYARYTENFKIGANPNNQPFVGGVQQNALEYTVGYVVHGPRLLGVKPFGSAGGGGINFHPTGGGGQGLPSNGRGAFYYAIGADSPVFTDHIGIRAQFREVFFKAPDYGQNYLTINKRTSTFEPGIGLYLRF